jgi:hypothetical protein
MDEQHAKTKDASNVAMPHLKSLPYPSESRGEGEQRLTIAFFFAVKRPSFLLSGKLWDIFLWIPINNKFF